MDFDHGFTDLPNISELNIMEGENNVEDPNTSLLYENDLDLNYQFFEHSDSFGVSMLYFKNRRKIVF